MKSDTIRLVFTLTIATVVIVGGGLLLYATRLDPPESNPQNLQLLLAGFIGAAIQFVFNRETQTQTARQVEHSVASEQARATGQPVPPG